jgi:hypothetical protein
VRTCVCDTEFLVSMWPIHSGLVPSHLAVQFSLTDYWFCGYCERSTVQRLTVVACAMRSSIFHSASLQQCALSYLALSTDALEARHCEIG